MCFVLLLRLNEIGLAGEKKKKCHAREFRSEKNRLARRLPGPMCVCVRVCVCVKWMRLRGLLETQTGFKYLNSSFLLAPRFCACFPLKFESPRQLKKKEKRKKNTSHMAAVCVYVPFCFLAFCFQPPHDVESQTTPAI